MRDRAATAVMIARVPSRMLYRANEYAQLAASNPAIESRLLEGSV